MLSVMLVQVSALLFVVGAVMAVVGSMFKDKHSWGKKLVNAGGALTFTPLVVCAIVLGFLLIHPPAS